MARKRWPGEDGMGQGANCRREEMTGPEKAGKEPLRSGTWTTFVRPVQEAGAGCKEGQPDSPFEGLGSSSNQV